MTIFGIHIDQLFLFAIGLTVSIAFIFKLIINRNSVKTKGDNSPGAISKSGNIEQKVQDNDKRS